MTMVDSGKLSKINNNELTLEIPQSDALCMLYQTWSNLTPITNGKTRKTFGLSILSLFRAISFYNSEAILRNAAPGNIFKPTICLILDSKRYYLVLGDIKVPKIEPNEDPDDTLITMTFISSYFTYNEEFPSNYNGKFSLEMSAIPFDIIQFANPEEKFLTWLEAGSSKVVIIPDSVSNNIVQPQFQFFLNDEADIKPTGNNSYQIALTNPSPITVYQVWTKYSPNRNICSRKIGNIFFSELMKAWNLRHDNLQNLHLDENDLKMFSFQPGATLTLKTEGGEEKNYLIEVLDPPTETVSDKLVTYTFNITQKNYYKWPENTNNWEPIPGGKTNIAMNIDSCSTEDTNKGLTGVGEIIGPLTGLLLL
jgi:hypothetical protein